MIIMSQIKIIDYRNARYQGQIEDQKFEGMGIILDDDFTFCLGNWKQNCLNGPMISILPDEKIFYGEFLNDTYHGFCCYHMGSECQVYCLAQNGLIQSPVAAVFPLISCVIKLSISSGEQITTNNEVIFESEQMKWELINNILQIDVPDKYRNIRKFVKQCVIGKSPYLEQTYGKQYSFGFKDGGLRAMINLQDFTVKQLGIYNSSNILYGMGKKIINRDRKVKEEGMYDELDGLVRYQVRPKDIKKRYRDFFRKSLDFENKFIRLHKIQEIQAYFNRLKVNITDNTTNKIAQQLLQNPIPDTTSLTRPIRARNQSGSQMKKNQVSLEKIQEQLNRSRRMGEKGRSRSKSPYTEMQRAPAELKYTRNTIAKAVLQEHSRSYQQPQKRPDKYYQRQPIEKNHNNSRSPHSYQKSQETPIKYFRRQEQINRLNPQSNSHNYQSHNYRQEYDNSRKQQKFPQRIYSNIELNKNSRTSPNKTKLDKMSTLYDRLQEQQDNERSRNRNKNYLKRDYHFNDEENMLDRKMGLVRQPRNRGYQNYSKSKSPCKNTRDQKLQFQFNKDVRDNERTAGYVHYRNHY